MPMMRYWKIVNILEFLCTVGMLPCQEQVCLAQFWYAGANSLMKSIHGLWASCSPNMSRYSASNFIISDIVKTADRFLYYLRSLRLRFGSTRARNRCDVYQFPWRIQFTQNVPSPGWHSSKEALDFVHRWE
jgi:hypothetical protein